MTTVPPPNVALPQVLAAAVAAPTIAIAQPPPALAALPVGTTIEAIVLPPPPNAAPAPPAPASTRLPTTAPVVVLQTALGDLQVRLPAPLPDKAQVDLEIVRSTPQQVTVRLTTVDGTPTLQYLAQNRTPAVAAPTPATPVLPVQTHLPMGPQPLPPGFTWMPSGPAPFVQTGVISAVVTQTPPMAEAIAPAPAPAPMGQPATPAALPPTPAPAAPPTVAALSLGAGSEMSLKIVSVQLPGAPAITAPPPQAAAAAPAPVLSPSPTPAATPSPTPPIATPSAAAMPAAATPPTLPSPPPQPGLVLASAQGLPPAAPQPPAAVQAAPALVTTTGVVVAVADSIPVVDIEGRQVRLNVRANLPVGTQIVFDVIAATPPRLGAPIPLPLPAAAVPMSGPPSAAVGWPTLTEAAGILQRSDPQAAQQLAQAIPDGGPRTVAAVISFVQAMRSGDARQWPGDTTLRALERSGPRGSHVAATLSGEVAELAARTRDAGTEWRALPIPWAAEGQIDRVALITRREGDSDADGRAGKKGGGTRFLIDLHLSRLGPMQLDGMFRKETRAFDLVLRTKTALPDEMRRDLFGIFTAANAAMGLKGGLAFQITKTFADPLSAGNTPDKSGLWA